MESELKAILLELQSRKNLTDRKRLIRAYEYGQKKHRGQMRQTGDDLFTHPVFVAKTLATWGLDQVTIEAGLLHEVVEMTDTDMEELVGLFGEDCGHLVAGVTRVGQVKLRGSQDEEFLENLRKMFVVMAKDVRVVLIRLADRLHNMMTLEAVPLSKQKRISMETLEVYAPLADRLGMGKLKGDFEDLAFPFVYPEDYQWLEAVARPHFKYSEENITETINRIRQQLAKQGVKARTEFRLKRRYSLFRKLLRPEIDRDISKIHDLMAVRIICKDTATCYAILGVVHQYWKPVPFLGISDFIAQPKPNGYQSIHTKVFDHRGNIVEIQIRSEAMHEQAEFGAAAHFAYAAAKHRGVDDEKLEKGVAFTVSQKMEWINQLASWQQQVAEQGVTTNDFPLDALSHRIYVFSPKGDVFDLPEGSTPVDFAFNVHTSLGYFIQSVKINDKISPIDVVLKSGDVVEILKTKKLKLPNRNWLRFVKSHKARTEIKKSLEKTGVE